MGWLRRLWQRLRDAFAKSAAEEKTARWAEDAIRSMTIEEYKSFRSCVSEEPICINCKWLLNSWLLPGLVPAKDESEYDVSAGELKYKVIYRGVCSCVDYNKYVNWHDTCDKFSRGW